MTIHSWKTAWLLFVVILPTCTCAVAAEVKWIQPTSEELAMTSEPKAPGASAIVLSYEETDDADSAEVTLHVRLKILTSGGVSAGNITLPSRIVYNDEASGDISARVVHADGTVIPFNGTPQNSTKVDAEEDERTLALPNVEVGSILEYVCHFRSQNTLLTSLAGFYAPIWRPQGIYFVRSAHFNLKAPSDLDSDYVRWVANLPPGASVKFAKNHVTLDMTNVSAAPDEEFSPPPSSTRYSVRIYYFNDTRDKYWGRSGDRVDSYWSDYYLPTKVLVGAADGIVHPGDTDEQKLHSLYAAVTQMENTDFTRRHTQAEDKKNGIRRAGSSEATWLAKRGDSDELALLFIALARAAGYSAYPMAVASRNRAIFNQDVLSWSQMDSIVAIVNVKGKEIFFDPSSRGCPFGSMAPWHSNVIGVSAEGKLVKIRYTPAGSYNDAKRLRVVDLMLSPDGSVQGTIKMTWAGTAGLPMRQTALRDDVEETRTKLEKAIQEQVPNGVQVKLTTLTGIAESDQPLTASFNLSGKLGTATSKRLILPSQFFESASRPMLAASDRTLPVAFPNAYSVRDIYTLHLSPGLSVEAMPAGTTFVLNSNDATYKNVTQSGMMAKSTGDVPSPVIVVQRVFILNKIDYPLTGYAEAHKFFGEIASSDQEPIILSTKPQQAKVQ